MLDTPINDKYKREQCSLLLNILTCHFSFDEPRIRKCVPVKRKYVPLNLHNNVASIQKNRGDKSHRVIVAKSSLLGPLSE